MQGWRNFFSIFSEELWNKENGKPECISNSALNFYKQIRIVNAETLMNKFMTQKFSV